MELFFELHDKEGVCHNKFKSKFSAEATLDQLQEKIHSNLNIHPERQHLFSVSGNEINGPGSSSLLEIGLKNLDKIVVKHSELPWWTQYKQCVKLAMKPDNERVANAKRAIEHHEKLMKSGFFDVYSTFEEYRLENHHKVAPWANGDVELIRDATERYFLAQHFKRGANDDSDFVCRFESRDPELGGSRKNTLVYVQLHGEDKETKYNVKCHHYGSTAKREKGQYPDLKELFCYKLLELINVGPHAQFILPGQFVGSRTCTYIATKWNDNFESISNMKYEDVSVDVLIQLLLLRVFLFISQWKGTKMTAIIDFSPPVESFIRPNVKEAMFNIYPSINWKTHYFAGMKKCDEKARMEIAKEYLEKWDLLSNIDKANELINPEKDRMKNEGIGFKGQNGPTEDLVQYISDVKQNLKKLTDMLNTGE